MTSGKRFVVAFAAGATILASACGGPSSHRASAPTTTTTGSGGPVSPARTAPSAAPQGHNTPAGGGTLRLTLGTEGYQLEVVCQRRGSVTTVSGSGSSGLAADLTIQGPNTSSAAIVATASSGMRTIWQAINGLRDDAGRAVGALKVTSSGTTYSGQGTFVITTLDRKGAEIKSTGADSEAGSFSLQCRGT